MNDWQKERQFKALNERKEERGVKVTRDGVDKMIDIKVGYSQCYSNFADFEASIIGSRGRGHRPS